MNTARRAKAGRGKRAFHAAESDDPFAAQPSQVEDVTTSGDVRRRRVDASVTTLPLRPPPHIELAFGNFSYGDIDPTIPPPPDLEMNTPSHAEDIPPPAIPNVKIKTKSDRYDNSVCAPFDLNTLCHAQQQFYLG